MGITITPNTFIEVHTPQRTNTCTGIRMPHALLDNNFLKPHNSLKREIL